MSSRPSENFAGNMRFVRIITRCVGVDAYDENFRINGVTIFTATSIVLFTIFTFLTVVKESKEDWMFAVQALAVIGIVVQGVNKMCVGLIYSKKVCELYTQIRQIYTKYEKDPDPRYAQVLLRNCHKVRRALFLVGISYLVGTTGMITASLVATKVTGKLNLPMHFHILGIDIKSKFGEMLTTIVHYLFVAVGGLGLYAGDMLIIVYLLQSFVFADILTLKVDELNTHVQRLATDKCQNESSQMLVGIAQWHQTYLGFITKCNKLFYTMVSVQVASSAVSIVMTIFTLLTSTWISGYMFLCIAVPEMYLYCVLGTLLENCNDSVMYEIYNISLYDLTVHQQRFVLFMLAKSQQPEVIQLLGVMPLSVSTALQITKSIYSITMMMARFLNKH